jgi:hypothetical protein
MNHDLQGWECSLSVLPFPSPFFIFHFSIFLGLLCVLCVSVVHFFWAL